MAFGDSLGSGFHLDDYGIFSDRALTTSSGWMSLWSIARARPLTYLTFWLNYQVGGQDPLGYHALNLLLHLGAVLVAFACLRRLLPERAALVAAAIFALHPLQAESVDYVWSRSTVLATLLCLVSLWEWLRGRHWIAVVWFAAALLARESVAAFPVALLLWDRKHGKQVVAMLGLAAAAGAHRLYAVTPSPDSGTTGQYLLAQGAVVLRYLRLLLVPYGFTIDPDIRVPPLWLGLLAWAAVLAIGWVAWKRKWLWLLAALILLLPRASVFRSPDLAMDARMYFPLFAFAAGGAVLLERWKAPAAVRAAVVAILAILSMARTSVWASDEALWREAVKRAPEKIRPRIQLARDLRAADALEVLAAAGRMAPEDPRIAAEMGRVLLSQGQAQAALEEFSHALAADPHNAQNFNGRGVAFGLLGQTAAARADFERALELDPGLDEARENLRKLSDGPRL
jgi:tetratricopeptide (TPR) repeat protein